MDGRNVQYVGHGDYGKSNFPGRRDPERMGRGRNDQPKRIPVFKNLFNLYRTILNIPWLPGNGNDFQMQPFQQSSPCLNSPTIFSIGWLS